MGFNGVFANKQRLGNLIIGRANTQFIKDLFFTMGEERRFMTVKTVVRGTGN